MNLLEETQNNHKSFISLPKIVKLNLQITTNMLTLLTYTSQTTTKKTHSSMFKHHTHAGIHQLSRQKKNVNMHCVVMI